VRSFANAIIVLWGWRRFLVALVAGALSALAMAPFNAFPLLWLTFPVLVWLVDGATPREGAGFLRRLAPAAIVGWSFGFGYFLAGLWWVGAAFLVEADVFGWLMPIAVIILPAGMALYWAFGIALARVFWKDGWPRIVILAVALAMAEWLRGHLFTGFPWNAIGYALTPMPLMMQSASLVGIWGLTLVAVLIFAAPAVLADDRRLAPRAPVAVLAVAALLLAAHVGYGAIRLSGGPDAMEPGVRFRLVQPAIPLDRRWGPAMAAQVMQRFVDVTGDGKGSAGLAGITHVIWPESAFPFLLTQRPDALAAIADLLPPGTTLVTGAARGELPAADGEEPRVFNSVYVMNDSGEITAAYDKVHLVPFGEYIPLSGLLRALGLRQLIQLPGGFSPGDRRRALSVPGVPFAAPLICYEIIFPGEALAPGIRPGWLLNLTDDAWFGDTPGPYQHYLQARVRAVEEGLPLIRVANSGISAIVDAHGRVLVSLPLDQMGFVDGGLPAALAPTPYARFGDAIFLVLLVFSAGIGFLTKVNSGI